MVGLQLIKLTSAIVTQLIIKNFILLVFILFFIKLAFIHFKLIGNYYPNEYREGAVLLNTHLIVTGGNPYDIANQPVYTNVYGIFYHLVVYPFAKIFAVNLPVHRAVSAFFIVGSCIALFLTMRWLKISFLLALSGTIILYGHFLFYTNPLARPDSLGLFLFLCSIIIPWRCQYSLSSLILSIGIGIMAFLTKPYFVLALPYLTFYLFIFKSKQLGIKYGFASILLLLFTVLIFNQIFETYLNNTFFIHVNVANSDVGYAIKQIYAYGKYNFGITLLLVIYLFYYCRYFSLAYNFTVIQIKNAIISKFDLINIKKPLININVDLMEFCLLLSLLIFSLKLGQHRGTWLVYIHQLISPFLIIVLFKFLNKQRQFNLLFFSLIILNLFSISSAEFLPTPNYGLSEWRSLSNLISRHQNIFNSPAIVQILIDQEKKVYDSGQSQYFIFGAERNPLFNALLPKQEKIVTRSNQFLQEITESVALKKYDLIVLTKHLSFFIPEELLKKHYQYQETLSAPIPHRNLQFNVVVKDWKLDIWKPKK